MAASVETNRVLGLLYLDDPVLLSPDGTRYLVATIRGDLARNGNWVELITGSTKSLDAAARPRVAARLFTTSGQSNRLRDFRRITWLEDNERIVFPWKDDSGPTRIVSLNLRTHELETLVTHSQEILEFSISGDGQSIVLTAVNEDREVESQRMRHEGFAVSSPELHALLSGYLDGRAPWASGDVLVWTRSRPTLRRVALNARRTLRPPEAIISPDGRWALVELPPDVVPAEWNAYTSEKDRTGNSIQDYVSRARRFPDEPAAHPKQPWIIDVEHATARPLWNAPVAVMGASAHWSRDGRAILLQRTFLPVGDAGTMGLRGEAAVQIDPATGRHTPLVAGSDHDSESIRPKERKPSSGMRITWRQDHDVPPVLFAVDSATGRERRILEVNPQLQDRFTLGDVEIVHWNDVAGRHWSGRLYYPVAYRRGLRYPLVIQSHPAISLSQQFSLNGFELVNTAYAAQPLANRGMAVLSMGGPDGGLGNAMVSPEERQIALMGYESAVDHLSSIGVIAQDKVGLVGFSRSGQYVLHAVTTSRTRWAAAIVADNSDASYYQYVMVGELVRNEMERVIGAAPFGDGLKIWFDRAPGFNAHRIHTPLRMEREDGGLASVIASWEIFSNLRYLRRPVELYCVPDIDDAEHSLEKPLQILASQGGTVDWMDYWLNGREDSSPDKAAQYQRWRKLRGLYEEDPGHERNSNTE